MLPFLFDGDDKALPFKNGDYIIVPNVAAAVRDKVQNITAHVIYNEASGAYEAPAEINLKLGELTDDERKIILAGCLINYYRG